MKLIVILAFFFCITQNIVGLKLWKDCTDEACLDSCYLEGFWVGQCIIYTYPNGKEETFCHCWNDEPVDEIPK
ncbi:Hypothetical protein SRAE_X000065300 [Strongyloides ratti]|uniref:Uncharacterized protein n=1 Tax=Strongyloides ratti TaxID=34506 RepID=A0A090LNJ9_STRRB|nr:Hypothetical protein SRAE_X000065300 [Strongyloides ratti]CEF71326.1 Hypothetical protein SRAE_X000065300 [Strongyloides ratti]